MPSFMWHDPDNVCEGCSMFTDNVGHLAHLDARDVSFALVSHGPLAEITPVKRRMGWTIPWYRTYFTTGRGVERLGSDEYAGGEAR